MKKILPYEVVKQLIQKSGFGTYTLFVMPDNNKVGGSHLLADKDDEGRMTVDNLVIDLEGNIDLLGNGLYRIVLKKSNKSQVGTEVSYFFEVREGVEAGSSIGGNGYSGLGADKIEEIVTNRVNQLVAAKEKELEAKREMDVLKAEIETLKKRKPPMRKKGSDLAGLLNIGLVAGSAFITEQWPNTKGIVGKALDAIQTASEEEEEEEETGFVKPE